MLVWGTCPHVMGHWSICPLNFSVFVELSDGVIQLVSVLATKPAGFRPARAAPLTAFSPTPCTSTRYLVELFDRNRESIMIWLVPRSTMAESRKHTFISYTVCPYKPRTRLNFLAIVRKMPILVSPLFRPRAGRKTVGAGAGIFRTKAARRRVNEYSYGDVVRNLKG